MPITIAGSGTITGISAGGLPDDCITTADIAANAVTYAKLGTTEQGQLCKAWVNFNGTANTNLTGTYSQSGTTVTVSVTAHGLITGNVVYADITSGTGVDGTYTVTVTDANTFTYTAGTSLTTSGNVTLLRNTIRASYNVSSITDNGVGDYTVNFATALADANYSAVITVSRDGAAQGNAHNAPATETIASTAYRFVAYAYGTYAYGDHVINTVAIFR